MSGTIYGPDKPQPRVAGAGRHSFANATDLEKMAAFVILAVARGAR
jgi:hypothetical protein